ncbi:MULTISPECIES: MaoC/PaaZ C-terminal domain-containing protein [unclassified Xanthobacter]|uniref:MaoC/PaaZ C-terminal domain-containing protein n=1 Tax=unclassified Xanthobacter TaxID=2623496 RepID=UPI001EE0282A|nr:MULTISPECIES: MaoC/PaaZ C-terminal domain-containing protein [unclassified Xanthobacter]
MTGPLPHLNAACCGTRLGPVETELTPRKLMSYAAALGATNDIYMDDLRAGGIIGLPPFAVVPEWEIMNGRPYRDAVGMDDAGMWACLHVQQDSTFLAPLHPGMRIATSGEIACVRRTRLGAYVATRLTTCCAATGAPLVESWFCGIFLDRFPDGPDRAVATPPDLLTGGFSTPPRPLLRVERTLPHLYSEASAIWNPIHTERLRARETGLPDILLHGTCTWAAAGRALIDLLGEGDPTRLRRLGGRFSAPALVERELFISVEPAAGRLWRFQVTDDRGAVILADGKAIIA